MEPQPAALVITASKFSAKENIEIHAREGTRHVAHAGVSRQRPATGLAGGDDHFAAVRGQNANGRVVQRRKAHLRNASGEQGHARAPDAGSGIRAAELGKEKFAIDRRQQSFSFRKIPSRRRIPVARASDCRPECW